MLALALHFCWNAVFVISIYYFPFPVLPFTVYWKCKLRSSLKQFESFLSSCHTWSYCLTTTNPSFFTFFFFFLQIILFYSSCSSLLTFTLRSVPHAASWFFFIMPFCCLMLLSAWPWPTSKPSYCASLLFPHTIAIVTLLIMTWTMLSVHLFARFILMPLFCTYHFSIMFSSSQHPK